MLRNPIYTQADLELYEFFKGQGAVVVNEAADFAGTNGCYLYQGRDVQERKNKDLKNQILVLAPSEGIVPADTWLRCRKKLMANITFQGGRKPKNTWLAGWKDEMRPLWAGAEKRRQPGGDPLPLLYQAGGQHELRGLRNASDARV